MIENDGKLSRETCSFGNLGVFNSQWSVLSDFGGVCSLELDIVVDMGGCNVSWRELNSVELSWIGE